MKPLLTGKKIPFMKKQTAKLNVPMLTIQTDSLQDRLTLWAIQLSTNTVL